MLNGEGGAFVNYQTFKKGTISASGDAGVSRSTLTRRGVGDIHEDLVIAGKVEFFCDCFEIVVSEKLRYVKNGEKRLSIQNTVGKLRSEYRRYFEGTAFEQKYIDEITKKDVENICFANLERYELRKKAFLGMRGILKSVFVLAYGEYWTTDNVYMRVDFKKFNDMISAAVPVEMRVHSDDTIERIMDYIAEKHQKAPKYLPAYALELQIIMGLRRGEVPPLMWSDVKEDCILISKEQITVKKSDRNEKEYFCIVHHSKTYKDRKYPLTSDLQAFLDRLRAVHEKYGIKSPYLFPADSETGVITNNTVYEFYRRMCRALEIPISRDTVKGTHSFRRNAITKAVNSSGGNVLLASQLFGNSPEVAEANYYTGLDMAEAKEILEAM